MRLRKTVSCAPIQTISQEACLCFHKRCVRGEVKGAREMGRGKDLLVRPPGRGMVSTLHPGKGSLRSSGPICSRRGKWHIIGSRPDKGLCVYYITRHQAHLSFITYIPPPHQEREKGEWVGKRKGNVELTPSLAQRVLFPPGQSDTLQSARHHTALFLPLFSSSFFSPLSVLGTR